MANKTVEEITKDWQLLVDYHAYKRVKDGSTLGLNTLRRQCEEYRNGTKTAKEIGFTPHWIASGKVLLIERNS